MRGPVNPRSVRTTGTEAAASNNAREGEAAAIVERTQPRLRGGEDGRTAIEDDMRQQQERHNDPARDLQRFPWRHPPRPPLRDPHQREPDMDGERCKQQA